MKKETQVGLMVAVGLALLVAAVIGVTTITGGDALRYTIYFDDAKGLEVGDKVVMDGLAIGVVKNVELIEAGKRIDVDLKIDPEYNAVIREDSTGMIKANTLINVSGQMVVEIYNPSNDKIVAMMENGAEVEGLNGQLDYIAWKTANTAGNMGRAIGDAGSAVGSAVGNFGSSALEKANKLKDQAIEKGTKLASDLQELKDNPLVVAAMTKLMNFLQLMKEKGIDGIEMLKEKWPDVKDDVLRVIDELKGLGAESAIDKLRDILQDVDRVLESWDNIMNGEGEVPAE